MKIENFLKNKKINNNIILTICNFGYVQYTHNLFLSCKFVNVFSLINF